MVQEHISRRSVLQTLAVAGGIGFPPASTQKIRSAPSITDPHTRVTFRAVVDMVVPRTPALRSLGEEHVPGGLTANIDEYLIKFLNSFVSFGLPRLGELGTLRLAEIIAVVLDLGATTLIALGENEKPPELSRALDLLDLGGLLSDPIEELSEGPFAKLSRQDRLRAIHVLDTVEFDTAELPEPLVEGDAGIIGQFVIGFTEVGYYGEWQGYTDFTAPPDERGFRNDPSAVQSWRQTDFPGIADGYAVLRGYWGTPTSPLGTGQLWKTIDKVDSPVELRFEPGNFRENDYDTDGYEEIYPEQTRKEDSGTGEVSG
ncbi:hypothetical protein [Halocatena salina]|uniref:Gluconate 2-dehydrogenase subunit 3 family protein n=1 Tax=Halocatena salina TaxID=2934340 RepID=A0A8U0A6W6_9EURY|nr:hypothetical protein [Halocatena salina]UPM44744.1 hypothetical protein MW046_17090 [Halocatena salina]